MSSGPPGKGPRLWLQPERTNANGSVEEARWVIRDGSLKRSTGLPRRDAEGAERALQQYIADKHDPRRHDGDPNRILIVDVMNVFALDIAAQHARPKETASRIRRLAAWWGDPRHAMQTMARAGRTNVQMTGFVADINSTSGRAYAGTIKGQRTASIDLELLRAACKHAAKEKLISSVPNMWLPPKSEPRQRWLTRSEVARLLWLALRGTRSINGRSRQPRRLARSPAPGTVHRDGVLHGFEEEGHLERLL